MKLKGEEAMMPPKKSLIRSNIWILIVGTLYLPFCPCFISLRTGAGKVARSVHLYEDGDLINSVFHKTDVLAAV